MNFTNLKKLRIAIVCDWLTSAGGAEKVILGLHHLFPNAPIYTSLYDPQKVKGFENAQVHTSWLQKIPKATKYYQFFLKQFPGVFENMDLDDYDIVISSSHSCAKGLVLKPETLHICYCHSPMRYAWENHQNYIKEYSVTGIVKKLAPFFIHKIRLWDRLSADRVDTFIANSRYIQNRIHKYYRRDSEVIYPFINPEKFTSKPQKDYFLAVGRLTSYKKFDLLVDTFNDNGLKLKIAGTGNTLEKLRKEAKPNIEFLGYVPDAELKELFSSAKALLFPQCEDFGIIPLEAMASGCPVIAYAQGGALETVKDEQTGILFDSQTPDSINDAINRFELTRFDRDKIISHARNFSQEKFNEKFLTLLETKWKEHTNQKTHVT